MPDLGRYSIIALDQGGSRKQEKWNQLSSLWSYSGNYAPFRAVKMKRAGRLFFLLTFALLQCVSPLAHAHIGGDASGGRFHIFHFHDVQHPHAHANDDTAYVSRGGHRFHASDLPVVKVPDGKRRSHATAPLTAPARVAVGIRPGVSIALGRVARLNRERIPFPPPYLKQPAHAPPARA